LACNKTGYQGRTGLFELLVVNEKIRELIHSSQSEAEIRSAGLAGGMQLMREDGERLIAMGITSLEEVLRVTKEGEKS
jgi:general secretion pathway protein E